MAQKERVDIPKKPCTPCKMEKIPQVPLIINVDTDETSRAVEESPVEMMVEKVKKPYIRDQKPLYGISYYKHSYKKIKRANIKLLSKNHKLKSELDKVRQKLQLHESKEGLNTLLKAVEETGKLQSSTLLDGNNSKGKQVQEDDKMKQKDIALVITIPEENLVSHVKMMEWKGKAEELRNKLDRLMKQQEETKPLQRGERMRYRQTQLEINKL